MLKMQSSARRKAYITAMKLLMGVAAVLTCALVVGMIGYILGNGIPNITWEMLSTAPSYLANRVGILPDIAVGLKVSEVTVGNLVSLFAFVYAPVTPLGSALSARFPRFATHMTLSACSWRATCCAPSRPTTRC